MLKLEDKDNSNIFLVMIWTLLIFSRSGMISYRSVLQADTAWPVRALGEQVLRGPMCFQVVLQSKALFTYATRNLVGGTCTSSFHMKLSHQTV